MAPTLLELAGIKIPEDVHGKSIVPLIKRNKVEWRKEFIYEGLGTYGGAKPNLTAISENYRYIETYDNRVTDNPTFIELYNQKIDSMEMNNLAGSPQYRNQIIEFKRLINDHINTILK
jgi:arylsulfatase A-like enzyme